MADGIKIGNLDISYFKVGSSDCTIYLGDTLLYPIAQSYKWLATYTGGTTSSAECDSTSSITENEITLTNLVSVEIGDCVTSIGSYAFYDGSSLTSVTIPDSVTSIGDGAFRNTNITSLYIPDSVTSIGALAFRNCFALTSVEIGTGITSIDDYAFRGCTGLTSFTINATTPPTLGTSDIFQSASNCPIYVPTESVDTYKAASGWSNYASRIQAMPFQGKWLATYTGGTTSSAECDASSAITENEIVKANLVSLEVGQCVTSINEWAFYRFTDLTSITLSDSVTTIGLNAFAFCSSLTSIDIPDSVTTINTNAFSNCSSLTSVTLPSGLTSISSSTFYNCYSLANIDISNVTSIGQEAFYNCSGLTSITIPSGVTSISDNTFYNCNSLTSLDIPDNITNIGTSAFRYCSGLTDVTIGSGVTIINGSAFRNCSSLSSITINAITPPTLGNVSAFSGTPIQSGTGYIYVPADSVETYQNATGWRNYASRIQAIPSPTPTFNGKWIGYYSDSTSYSAACDSTSAITKNEVRSGNYTAYTKVIIGDCVNNIREAFQRCSSMTEVEIGSAVTNSLYYCFEDCTALTSATWYVTDFGQYSYHDGGFQRCSSLQKLVMYAATPPSISSTFFNGVPNTLNIYVPDEAISTYQSAYGWSNYTIKGHSQL